MKQVKKRWQQPQRSDDESAFDIKAHKTDMPIGKLASECTSQRDHYRRETHERHRKGGETKKKLRFC